MPTEGFHNPASVLDQIGIAEGMVVADLGCGSGEIAMAMARRVGPNGFVNALDVLPTAIESVQAKIDSEHLENIHGQRVDLERSNGTKLSDKSQNLVYLGNVLWQTGKKQEVIREAARIAVSGGTVAAVEWNPGTGGFGPPAESRVSEESLRKLMSDAGLTVERVFPAGSYHYGLVAKKNA